MTCFVLLCLFADALPTYSNDIPPYCLEENISFASFLILVVSFLVENGLRTIPDVLKNIMNSFLRSFFSFKD